MISPLGFILYIIVLYVSFYVETIKAMLEQALLLAPELSAGMFTLYFYPLILCSFLRITRKTSFKHGTLLRKQTNISASVAVSLGLIGTFLGLTAMVAAIASSMGGDGDMADRMGAMLSAISEALSAMSYAFLTSILGVGVSVLLILSLNFWMFGFASEEKPQTKALDVQPSIDAGEFREMFDNLILLTEINQQSAENISKLMTGEMKTELLIEGLREINQHNKFIYNDFLEQRNKNKDFFKTLISNYENIEHIKNENNTVFRQELTYSIQSLEEKFAITHAHQIDLLNLINTLGKENIKEQQNLNQKSQDNLDKIRYEVELSKLAFQQYTTESHTTTQEIVSTLDKIKKAFRGKL